MAIQLTAIRSAQTMSPLELRESATRRIHAVALRFGANSPQAAKEIVRWSAVLDSQVTVDDTMAIVDALGGVA